MCTNLSCGNCSRLNCSAVEASRQYMIRAGIPDLFSLIASEPSNESVASYINDSARDDLANPSPIG